MKYNLGTLAAPNGTRNNETLMYSVVTHTGTPDVEHKITCAMAGSNCSDPALKLQTYLGNVPVGYATQDALLRAALTGVGTQIGSVTRVGETVVGIGETVWALTPYERLKSSYSDIGYLQENGIGATLRRNFDQFSSVASSLVGGVKGYVAGVGSAIATDALGSWDIYDLYEQGKTQGKVGVDILSLLTTGAGAAGKVGIVEGAAAKTADDVIDAINAARSTASKGVNPGYPKLPPGDTVRFIADSAGNTIDLHYTNGLMD
jgi:filamentous hemagglutinin